MRLDTKTVFITFVLVTTLSTPAFSERVLLCFPGGPGSTSDAQPIVDRFVTRLAGLSGWKSATGTYINDMTSCESAFKQQPNVVMVPLDLFLLRQQDWHLRPLATLKNDETSSSYHIYAKSGLTLADLKDQTVVTNLKESTAFLGRVGFAGKVDAASAFKLERVRSAKKAIKSVLKGKAKAAVINSVQLKSFKGLPLTKDLVAIHTGPTLPGAIVATVNSDGGRLASALKKLCKSDAALCKEMRLTGFGAVDKAQLESLGKALKP